MAKYTIYHNPRCTKSRNALKLLESEGVGFDVVEYLDNPLSQKAVKDLLSNGDFELKELIRTKEAKEFGVDLKGSTDAQLVKAITEYPKIMQRPVVSKGKKVTIARDEDWFSRL